MLVTLFTDASFYHETQSAAYALYAISEVDRLQFAGPFKGTIESSAKAELAAIANALSIILPHRLSAGATRVLIQADHLDALHAIDARKHARYGAIVASIHASLDKYGVGFETRHVKAHSGRGEPRLYCHDWCDRECRRIARALNQRRLDDPRWRTHGRKTVAKPRKRRL